MQKIAILYDASQAVLSTFDLDEVLRQIVGLSAQEMADRLMAGVLGFRGGPPRDDIAVLVVKMVAEVATSA